MGKSKTIIFIAIIMIMMIVIVPTIMRINETHQKRLMKVEVLAIKEGALKCYLKKDCPNPKIYLAELVEKKYVVRGIDPRSDEYFKDNIYVLINNDVPTLYIDDNLFE